MTTSILAPAIKARRLMRPAVLVNLVLFQVGWFSCVLGAAHGVDWFGPVVVAAWVSLHVALQRDRRAEAFCVVAAFVLGYATDGLLVLGGAIEFHGDSAAFEPTRGWMLALWVNLAATLRLALGWLQGRPALAAILGGVSGPAAYFSAAELDAVSIPEPVAQGLSLIAVAWAIALPILFWISRRVRSPADVSTG